MQKRGVIREASIQQEQAEKPGIVTAGADLGVGTSTAGGILGPDIISRTREAGDPKPSNHTTPRQSLALSLSPIATPAQRPSRPKDLSIEEYNKAELDQRDKDLQDTLAAMGWSEMEHPFSLDVLSSTSQPDIGLDDDEEEVEAWMPRPAGPSRFSVSIRREDEGMIVQAPYTAEYVMLNASSAPNLDHER
ncbi:hypothetical protein MMC30_007164 [Trapelia coarctata]|nr:hypothetical protein [Trapelia coarctata]